ncbi:MAG: regulatory iron-sulfur-containing complex subunit RicT [Dehalococcoidia bacterium]
MNETNQDIVGVRFTEAGAVSYCRRAEIDLGVGDYVVVRTDRGERLGWVVIAPDQVLASEHQGPMRLIDRLATEADVESWRQNKERGDEDVHRAQELAARADPRIRVAAVEYDLAGELCDLTFAASERIGHDWLRQQTSELFGAEVRVDQVGDRDRAKAIGGLGVCGRALCCATWQTEFPTISIRMAKDQDLSPNPSKISGVCGRLLCCLSYEVEAYQELRGDLPQVGKRVTTPVGRARVLSVNALKQVVRLRIEGTGEVVEIPADDMRAQYGTAVRPEELDRQVEEPLRRQDRERQASTVAVLTPVDGRGAESAHGDGGDGASSADASSEKDEQPRRRRRRGRRGGRRRRRGGSGGGGGGSNGGSGSSDS